MSRRPPLQKQSSHNPFAADDEDNTNPFADDDDEVLEDEEDEEAAPTRAAAKRPQTTFAPSKPKHVAPSFDDDDEEEQAERQQAEDGDEEVIDNDDEDDSPVKSKWIPAPSSMFARALPPSSPAKKTASAKPTPAKKATAPPPTAAGGKDSNPFASRDVEGKKAAIVMKADHVDTNPFSPHHSSTAPAKKVDSNQTASSAPPTASFSAAATKAKADTKAITATAQSSSSLLPTTAAKPAASAAKPAAAAPIPKPTHKREDSNPFASYAPTDSKPAAKPVAASATVKRAVASSPSGLSTPSASPVAVGAPSSAKSTASSVSSASAVRTPVSVPSLRIDSDTTPDAETMEAVDLSSALSPASAKRDAVFRRRLAQAVQAASRIELSAFRHDFNATLFTAGLTAPLFELMRERWPVEADEGEEAAREAEEEEEEGDGEDDDGEGEEGEQSKVSEADKQRRRREQQLKRDATAPRLRRRAFDPEPFSSLFSLALTRLDTLRDNLDAAIVTANGVTARAEAEHSKKMATFSSTLSSLTARFHRLDRRISSVSHTAVRIGSTLDTINTSKQNSLRAYDLLTHFIAFNTGDTTRLSPLFSSSASSRLADMYAAAEVIQTLEGVTAEVRGVGTERAVALIAKVSEECESRLLARFEEAMEKGGSAGMEEMKGMAKVLLGFKGKNVIKRYVFAAMQQIENNCRKSLALSQGDEEDEEDEEEPEREEGEEDDATVAYIPARRMTVDTLASPVVSSFRTSLRIYYRSILSTLRSQCKICSAVFPLPSSIIRAIVERVFSDKVADFIDAAIAKPGLSGENELLMLAVAQQQTEKLTQQLHQLIKTLSPSSSSSSSSSSAIDGSTLIDMMNGVFQRYRDSYVSKETTVLRARCMSLINSTLASQAGEEANAAASVSASSSSSEDSSTDYFGFKRRAALLSSKQRWIVSALENEVVDTVLQDLLLSMRRCDALSDLSALGDNAYAIFSVVLGCVIDDYVRPIYAQIVPFIPAADPKTEPDAFYFLCVRLLSSIADRLRQHYTYFILPRLLAHTNTQAVCEQRMRELLGTVESELLAGLNRCLTAQLRFMQRHLSKQKPNDYKPKDEESLFSGRPTAACAAVVESMHHAYHCVVSNMEGRNTDTFLSVLGLRCYDMLVEHLQRMQVSELGAGLLSRDCKEYEGMVIGWHISVVVEKFGILRSVSNLFFVSADNLAAWVAQEARVKGMDREELMKFVRMRADYVQNKQKIHATLLGS